MYLKFTVCVPNILCRLFNLRTAKKIMFEITNVGAAGAPLTNQQPESFPALSKPQRHIEPLDQALFPDRPTRAGSGLPATKENLAHLLDRYGISIHWNVIKKRIEINIPWIEVSPQNREAVMEMELMSLASRNGLPTSIVDNYLLAIADGSPYNPVADWISSKRWDGRDRLGEIYATVSTAEDFPVRMKEVLMRKFLLSMVAAAVMPTGFRSRGVLTLQGRQGLGKTSWIGRLLPSALGDSTVKLGHSWDGGNKDARLSAIQHLLVEFGELEGAFRKEISGLKAFITQEYDKIRPPYARRDMEYPRQTVFCASVNDSEFLIDTTGNSRFWTLPVEALDYQHEVDMQQLFAQLKAELDQGAIWWLDQAEEEELNRLNQRHRALGPIGEKVLRILDLDRIGRPDLPRLSASQVLELIGFDRPTNPQSKECNAVLREHLGESRRINGVNVWRVPLKLDLTLKPGTGRKPAPAVIEEEEVY